MSQWVQDWKVLPSALPTLPFTLAFPSSYVRLDSRGLSINSDMKGHVLLPGLAFGDSPTQSDALLRGLQKQTMRPSTKEFLQRMPAYCIVRAVEGRKNELTCFTSSLSVDYFQRPYCSKQVYNLPTGEWEVCLFTLLTMLAFVFSSTHYIASSPFLKVHCG